MLCRFEEVEEQDTELLLPLGSHSVMVLNEQHTMSMLVIFLQLDCTTLERACLLEVFTHLVRERIVTKLRHVVILGHGIGCDIRKLHGNTGLRITVESQFPPSAVNTAVEESLAELEAHLRSLTHADFKVHINALKAAKMEAHMKMGDLAAVLWREVADSTYDFRRHHRECEHLNFLTLSKVRPGSGGSRSLTMCAGAAVLQAIHSEGRQEQEEADTVHRPGPHPQQYPGEAAHAQCGGVTLTSPPARTRRASPRTAGRAAPRCGTAARPSRGRTGRRCGSGWWACSGEPGAPQH